MPAILRALDDAGWEGLYDIEIFSDDGTFGSSYPDSYWAAPADDVLAQARETFAALLGCHPSAYTPLDNEGAQMTRPSTRMGLILAGVLIAVVALATTAAARTSSPAAGPIVIGWAYDSKGAMAPFDNPALAAAQLRVKAAERKGRRQRTQAADQDVRHAGQQGCDRKGVRSEAAERRCERDVHDV